MLYAIKANRQYEIEEGEKQKFIDKGYKIAKLNDNKLVFEEVKTEETKEIIKLKTENEKLKSENKKLETELKKTKGESK